MGIRQVIIYEMGRWMREAVSEVVILHGVS
jgi:hypothetical protein